MKAIMVKAMAMSVMANVGIASVMILNSSDLRKERLVGESLRGRGEGGGWGRRERFVLQLFKESILVFDYQINGWNVEVECRNVEVRMFDAKKLWGD